MASAIKIRQLVGHPVDETEYDSPKFHHRHNSPCTLHWPVEVDLLVSVAICTGGRRHDIFLLQRLVTEAQGAFAMHCGRTDLHVRANSLQERL